MLQPHVVIIGAGPGGLTAAREVVSRHAPCVILEQDLTVGGLAKTVRHNGYRFDLGGHRFFSKVSLINQIWKHTLGDDLLVRPRLSRIYYRSHFYNYPLKPAQALRQLGLIESACSIASFAKAKLFPRYEEPDLESWLINRFGDRLYRTFFKTYTEKVWGIDCRQIGADWAAQRIKGLNMMSLIRNALGSNGNGGPKTLIDTFLYPRLGPGMLWERIHKQVEANGAQVRFGHRVDAIRWKPGRVLSVVAGGREHKGSHFISTMPIRDLIYALDPAPPAEVLEAAGFFSYRDFLTVALMLKGRDYFPDNWIYVHEPKVKVGRIQNFGNWSPDMVGHANVTCLGMEYFCFEGDGLWNRADGELVDLAKRELRSIGLAKPENEMDGLVLRVPKAYPIYNNNYQEGLARIRAFLQTIPNLQLVGRNGMHRYNNMDHSMLTGILAARNVFGSRYDLWRVNADAEYLEEQNEWSGDELSAFEDSQPLVPEQV